MEISLDRADSEPKGSDASRDDSAGTKFHATTEHISDINTVPERRQVYVKVGLQGLFSSYYVVLCASFSAIGGMLFGIDQGIVSVILVMPQFLDQFPRVSATASGAGFWKGLLTAMIELGALIGQPPFRSCRYPYQYLFRCLESRLGRRQDFSEVLRRRCSRYLHCGFSTADRRARLSNVGRGTSDRRCWHWHVSPRDHCSWLP